MPQIWVFSFSFVTLEFSIHNFFKTRMLLEIFGAEFPYKLSYFEPLCLLNKMVAKTVKKSIAKLFSLSAGRNVLMQVCTATQLEFLHFWSRQQKLEHQYLWDFDRFAPMTRQLPAPESFLLHRNFAAVHFLQNFCLQCKLINP